MTEHKHAAMISEWIKDTSRMVQASYPISHPATVDVGPISGWSDWYDDSDPKWHPEWRYRFVTSSPIIK